METTGSSGRQFNFYAWFLGRGKDQLVGLSCLEPLSKTLMIGWTQSLDVQPAIKTIYPAAHQRRIAKRIPEETIYCARSVATISNKPELYRISVRLTG